jgi:hypothetical protein
MILEERHKLSGHRRLFHRRDAENTEVAQSPDSRTLRGLSGLCVSAVSSVLLVNTRG